jgi:hypothetical protein
MLTLLRSVLGKGADGDEAAKLADHWQLVRKVRESWEKLGLPPAEAWRMANLARAVLARTAPGVPVDAAGNPAAAIILDNYEAADFRDLLGVNRFEDVTWFNKEAFESTVSRACLFLLPESVAAFGSMAFGEKGDAAYDSAAAWKQRMDLIAGTAKALLKAEAASGFRVDALVELLSVTPEKAAPKETKTAKAAKKEKKEIDL